MRTLLISLVIIIAAFGKNITKTSPMLPWQLLPNTIHNNLKNPVIEKGVVYLVKIFKLLAFTFKS